MRLPTPILFSLIALTGTAFADPELKLYTDYSFGGDDKILTIEDEGCHTLPGNMLGKIRSVVMSDDAKNEGWKCHFYKRDDNCQGWKIYNALPIYMANTNIEYPRCPSGSGYWTAKEHKHWVRDAVSWMCKRKTNPPGATACDKEAGSDERRVTER
ncbi:hypothetical protein M011DRAFT_219640 [Sporormia fimetaria CBS 119925]|uniref:Secreted protein n=1 Tax=Sporormia fimetaria CBS 119925 TaxID=1340428 RepID=A0A6A6UZ76_9PLEO|nr:hypothetical protein M011DRAFT_219640 [Sporormia fimetaria CBS 119925]